jgi:hypothetical protein
MSNQTAYSGWHWSDGLTLGNSDGRSIPPRGIWQRAQLARGEQPELCTRGMHLSPTALEGLRYAPGLYVARAEIRGQIDACDDKSCGRERRDISPRVNAKETVLAWLEECVIPLARHYAVDAVWTDAAADDANAAQWATYAADAADDADDAAAKREMNADLERRLDALFAAAEKD